jgi:hypothetical protein
MTFASNGLFKQISTGKHGIAIGGVFPNNPGDDPTAFTFTSGEKETLTFGLDAIDFVLPMGSPLLSISLSGFFAPGDPTTNWNVTHISLALSGDNYFVPEPSTWAMMLLGFAGLGFAGYRRARAGRALAA